MLAYRPANSRFRPHGKHDLGIELITLPLVAGLARLRFFLEILHFDALVFQAFQSQLQRAANQIILLAITCPCQE